VPLPIECETAASPKKPLLAMSVQVNPAVLGELLLEMDDGTPIATDVPRGIYSTPLDRALSGTVIRLAECLYSPLDC